ncbi:MAG TPA: hypothetical protein VMP08_22070 [Anaerolineae bacterium]|nr:hypothetical protein [Anaerolineae bacterium]
MSKLDKPAARQTPTLPLNVFGRASRLLWEELFLLGVASYIWMLLGVFIVLLPPLTVGLMYMANQVARGNAISFTLLFSGARRFLSRSYIWGAINAFAIVLVLADLSYYQQVQGDLGIAAVTLAILLALAWSLVQLLTLPLLIELGPKSLRAAFRQALMLTISQPAFVIGLVVAMALLALLCWFFPIMIGFAFAYLALVVNIAIVKLRDPELDREMSQKRPRARR